LAFRAVSIDFYFVSPILIYLRYLASDCIWREKECKLAYKKSSGSQRSILLLEWFFVLLPKDQVKICKIENFDFLRSAGKITSI
jgi:hypothetical protein